MLSVLLELQRLKRLDRTGWVLRGQPPGAESVAAHSYGVALTAMLLADEVRARGVELDVGRVLRIAVLHDLAEARTGDMPRTMAEYYGAEARRRAEGLAFADVVRSLGEHLRGDYERLHEDYERRASAEARASWTSSGRALRGATSGWRGRRARWSRRPSARSPPRARSCGGARR